MLPVHYDQNELYEITMNSFYQADEKAYLIPRKIRAPLKFVPLIFAPLIFAHPQISRPFNFRTLLFYCKFVTFSFIRGLFSSPFKFRAFLLRKLAPFNFGAG